MHLQATHILTNEYTNQLLYLAAEIMKDLILNLPLYDILAPDHI